MGWPRLEMVAVGALLAVSACDVVLGLDDVADGAGGESSNSTGSTGGAGGASTTAGTGGAAAAGGGGAGCQADGDCTTSEPCFTPRCDAGACVLDPAPLLSPCGSGGGGGATAAAVCDGAGVCSSGAHLSSDHFGAFGDEFVFDAAAASDGSLLFGGQLRDSVGFGGPNINGGGGAPSAYLVRFNPDGTHQWSAAFQQDFSQASEVIAVDIDANGDALATGTHRGAVSFGAASIPAPSNNVAAVFVASIDAGGDENWSRSYSDSPGGASQSAGGIAADGGGNTYLVGGFNGTVDFGDVAGPVTSSGATLDAFVLQLDGMGQTTWQQTYQAAGSNEVARAVDTVDADSIVVAGEFGGTVNLGMGSESAVGFRDAFVMELNGAGVTQWVHTVGGLGASVTVSDVAAIPSGDIAVVGYFEGNVSFGGTDCNAGTDSDLFVLALSATGSYRWHHCGTGADFQMAHRLVIDPAGNVLIAGQTGGSLAFAGVVLPYVGFNDAFVAKLSRTGELFWAYTYGDGGDDRGLAIALNDQGGPWLLGSFAGDIDFGGGAMSATGALDVFVAKLGP